MLSSKIKKIYNKKKIWENVLIKDEIFLNKFDKRYLCSDNTCIFYLKKKDNV